MLIDWTDWKKMLMPGTVAVARRNRAITCRALSFRSGLSRSMMNMRPDVAAADRRHDRGDVGVASYDLGQRRLTGDHGVERGVVGADRRTGDLADILGREETLGHRLEQDRGHNEGAEREGKDDARHPDGT